MNIKALAPAYEEYLIRMRRHFHAHPELSGKEYETSRVVKAELDSMGISWRPCGMETGVLATIQGAVPGRTILLRADMDALPVTEETGLPYASQNPGVMHACGHDCHIASLLAAARLLNDHRDELCGTVKLAFQPSEETGQGAQSMIDNGALEGVDGCFAIHVWSPEKAGTVALVPGPCMAAADKFSIDIHGKGGHGSAPHQCVDAAVVASALVNNLQTVVSREIDPLQPAVVTVGRMDVGSRWNVVAEYAHLEGTTRCFSLEVYEALPAMMQRIVEDTARTFRAEGVLNYEKLLLPTVNDPAMVALASAGARKIMGEGSVTTPAPVTGGEDFSLFMHKVPGAIALMGVGNPACGAVWPQHSGKYCVDESVLLNSVMLYAQVAADFCAG